MRALPFLVLVERCRLRLAYGTMTREGSMDVQEIMRTADEVSMGIAFRFPLVVEEHWPLTTL